MKCVLIINYTTIYDEWPYANATGLSKEFLGLPDNTSRIEFEQELVQRDSHVRWAYWIVAVAHVRICNLYTTFFNAVLFLKMETDLKVTKSLLLGRMLY